VLQGAFEPTAGFERAKGQTPGPAGSTDVGPAGPVLGAAVGCQPSRLTAYFVEDVSPQKASTT